MDIWAGAHWYVILVYNILLVVLSTLIGLAVVTVSGAKLIDAIRLLLKAIRPAIDEPSDWFVGLIAAKTGRTREAVSGFLVQKLDEVAALLPAEGIPMAEVKALAPPPQVVVNVSNTPQVPETSLPVEHILPPIESFESESSGDR